MADESIHEILAGVQLSKRDGSTVPASEALEGKKKVLVYFSAHWCPPCRTFTPKLASAYDELKNGDVEIIFVSSDKTEDAAFDYMKTAHGDYFMTEFGDDASAKLKSVCGVNGIPMLCMFDGVTGKFMSNQARSWIANQDYTNILE